jgi:hypothetical protein
MSPLVILGAIGSIASVVGLYALYDSRRNRRIKLLSYEWTPPIPLATAAPVERDYKLSIHYTAAGAETEEVIEAAFVSYLRFANFGKEPIRRTDIAPANPLRIAVENERVLDISLSTQRRKVTRVALGEPAVGEDGGSAAITFDFLDLRDGAIIRVLTTGPRARLRLLGDIIGMPAGIRQSDETEAGDIWGKLGFGLWLLAECAAFAFVAWIVKQVTGSWGNAWLLVLPIVAFVLPIVGVFVLEDHWPSRAGKFPKELALPNWLGLPARGVEVGKRGDGAPLFVPHMYWPPELESPSGPKQSTAELPPPEERSGNDGDDD